NLLADSDEISLHCPNPGPMLKFDPGPSSGCNFIAPVIESARLGSARVRKLVRVGRKAQERLTELARERAFAGSGQECASGSSISGSAEGSYKKAS
ncbi:hypothetical protein BHE74_00057457, partial [Ensete ventricosum]